MRHRVHIIYLLHKFIWRSVFKDNNNNKYYYSFWRKERKTREKDINHEKNIIYKRTMAIVIKCFLFFLSFPNRRYSALERWTGSKRSCRRQKMKPRRLIFKHFNHIHVLHWFHIVLFSLKTIYCICILYIIYSVQNSVPPNIIAKYCV